MMAVITADATPVAVITAPTSMPVTERMLGFTARM
jgi:hypothetical protein